MNRTVKKSLIIGGTVLAASGIIAAVAVPIAEIESQHQISKQAKKMQNSDVITPNFPKQTPVMRVNPTTLITSEQHPKLIKTVANATTTGNLTSPYEKIELQLNQQAITCAQKLLSNLKSLNLWSHYSNTIALPSMFTAMKQSQLTFLTNVMKQKLIDLATDHNEITTIAPILNQMQWSVTLFGANNYTGQLFAKFNYKLPILNENGKVGGYQSGTLKAVQLTGIDNYAVAIKTVLDDCQWLLLNQNIVNYLKYYSTENKTTVDFTSAMTGTTSYSKLKFASATYYTIDYYLSSFAWWRALKVPCQVTDVQWEHHHFLWTSYNDNFSYKNQAIDLVGDTYGWGGNHLSSRSKYWANYTLTLPGQKTAINLGSLTFYWTNSWPTHQQIWKTFNPSSTQQNGTSTSIQINWIA